VIPDPVRWGFPVLLVVIAFGMGWTATIVPPPLNVGFGALAALLLWAAAYMIQENIRDRN